MSSNLLLPDTYNYIADGGHPATSPEHKHPANPPEHKSGYAAYRRFYRQAGCGGGGT